MYYDNYSLIVITPDLIHYECVSHSKILLSSKRIY